MKVQLWSSISFLEFADRHTRSLLSHHIVNVDSEKITQAQSFPVHALLSLVSGNWSCLFDLLRRGFWAAMCFASQPQQILVGPSGWKHQFFHRHEPLTSIERVHLYRRDELAAFFICHCSGTPTMWCNVNRFIIPVNLIILFTVLSERFVVAYVGLWEYRLRLISIIRCRSSLGTHDIFHSMPDALLSAK